ncbi:hypothetical protein AB1Y20_009788 [Prymnesium parvum]|uniref:Sucrose phosphatase-like domain-containing protein n=1 Tax=Prymnesium parvum TaxID=97485 RepID=A0AB34K2H9_PRYPA
MATDGAPPPRLKAIFSDLDGTIVHFRAWFEPHGARIVQRDGKAQRAVVQSPDGALRDCRLLPSSTMGDGVVSERTAALVQQLRDEGVLFVVVTAARKSTLLERLPLLPPCDAAVCETGSRIYLRAPGGPLAGGLAATPDEEFCARIEGVCGPLEREAPVDERPEPLWRFFRTLRREVPGLKCDSRSYYGCFRVDTRSDPAVDEALRACVAAELPPEVDWAMNLGKYDFFPRASGKGNAVAYLQEKWGLAPEECACLFDDDNDLPMAVRCGAHFLPGLTSDSVRRAAMEHPSWVVASKEGQGVFAIEECLEQLLARVKQTAAAPAAVP